jgi:hypothetical protein
MNKLAEEKLRKKEQRKIRGKGQVQRGRRKGRTRKVI